jgi:hypothetical protein
MLLVRSGLYRLPKKSVPGRKAIPQGLKPNVFAIIYGPTKEAAEKVCTERESNTTGAKARRILNHLRPD